MAARKTYLLRLSPEVWDALNQAASAELRSVNSQIELMLREGLGRRGVKIHPHSGKPPPGAEDADQANEEGSS
jgi:hypothetical protein